MTMCHMRGFYPKKLSTPQKSYQHDILSARLRSQIPTPQNGGQSVNMTTCHIYYAKKIGVHKHTLEAVSNTDRVVLSGKKWKVSHIKI